MDHALQILPFQFLGTAARQRLADGATRVELDPGEWVIAEEGAAELSVYLLDKGGVEVLIDGKVVGDIKAPAYFGERGALFGQRSAGIRAETAIVVYRIDRSLFLELIATCPAFRVSLSNLMRTKQRIFEGYDRFLAEVLHGASRGYLIVPRLLHLYRPLSPAIHSKMVSPEIDFSGLSYAIRRLPDNVTRTFAWFLTWDKPPELQLNGALTKVGTDARRRAVYELLPGKNLVILRDGDSDLIDLTTNLCLYAEEARKIREKLHDPDVIHPMLQGTVDLDGLPLSPSEVAGFRRLWGDEAEQRLRELILHHEDFAVHVFRAADNYNADHADKWTNQVARATQELVGMAPYELPEDYEVHIISSNTHSVTNCLSPWLMDRANAILAWGHQEEPELCNLPWAYQSDLVVALTRAYLDAHPEEQVIRAEMDQAGGLTHLSETAYTGIEVQLFDLMKLGGRSIDPQLPTCKERPGLIVNIDYAFGEQARFIIGSLVALFGHRIRSVSVLGKAGGLQGDRGDLLACTGFVEQITGRVLHPNVTMNVDRLKERVPNRNVSVGRTLTVAGTLLQNDTLLHFYKRVWDCTGLEMEGAYYCGELIRSQELGLLRNDVEMRFLYYVSDLPLNHEESLATSMGLLEGIPPLYAATREVLTEIFS